MRRPRAPTRGAHASAPRSTRHRCAQGVVRTDLARYLLGAGPDGVGRAAQPAVASGPAGGLQMLGLRAVAFFTRSVERGASTQVWLASGADGSAGGGYFEDLHEGTRSAASRSPELAAALWAESERLTGVTFDGLGAGQQVAPAAPGA